jgi:hypothetical protein
VTDQVDRPVLPLRRPPFAGVVSRTLAGSRPDWNSVGSPAAPEGEWIARPEMDRRGAVQPRGAQRPRLHRIPEHEVTIPTQGERS